MQTLLSIAFFQFVLFYFHFFIFYNLLEMGVNVERDEKEKIYGNEFDNSHMSLDIY